MNFRLARGTGAVELRRPAARPGSPSRGVVRRPPVPTWPPVQGVIRPRGLTAGDPRKATERLLESVPFSRITVNDIAREAGVSTGLLYSRFRSKDAILPFLVERFLADQRESFATELRAGGANATLAQRVARLSQRISGMSRSSLGLLRAAASRRLLDSEGIEEDERASTLEIRAIATRWLGAGIEEVERDDPERAVEFVTWVLFLAGQIGPMLMEDEREVEAMMTNLQSAMLLFLQTPGPTRGPNEESTST